MSVAGSRRRPRPAPHRARAQRTPPKRNNVSFRHYLHIAKIMENTQLKQLEEFKKIIVTMFKNCESIHNFDRAVYVKAYGEYAVSVVEGICESMPDVDKPNVKVQSALNIAYDTGFSDCMKMVVSIMDRTILSGEASFT